MNKLSDKIKIDSKNNSLVSMKYVKNNYLPEIENIEKQVPIWINVNEQLPSINNGHIDELVLICVKNKNKSDGIYLYDACSFDGESWGKRFHTWETILYWMPIPKNKMEK